MPNRASAAWPGLGSCAPSPAISASKSGALIDGSGAPIGGVASCTICGPAWVVNGTSIGPNRLIEVWIGVPVVKHAAPVARSPAGLGRVSPAVHAGLAALEAASAQAGKFAVVTQVAGSCG